jgi:hypothetical protein
MLRFAQSFSAIFLAANPTPPGIRHISNSPNSDTGHAPLPTHFIFRDDEPHTLGNHIRRHKFKRMFLIRPLLSFIVQEYPFPSRNVVDFTCTRAIPLSCSITKSYPDDSPQGCCQPQSPLHSPRRKYQLHPLPTFLAILDPHSPLVFHNTPSKNAHHQNALSSKHAKPKNSVILRRALCAEGPRHFHQHSGNLREFLAQIARTSAPIRKRGHLGPRYYWNLLHFHMSVEQR